MSQMYCLKCFYNLRGLVEHRCPECGNSFNPSKPATYSAIPHKERFNNLVKQASSLLSDALTAIDHTDPLTRAMLPLRRQVSRLSMENHELKQQLTALIQLLIDRNLIDADELAVASEKYASLAELDVVDDTENHPVETTENPTQELLDLQRAVDDTEK